MTCSGRGQICSALEPYNNLKITEWNHHSQHLNSLWPSDAIWRHRSWPTLARVMAWCRYPISQRPMELSDFSRRNLCTHYGDVIMGAMASRITSLTIVCTTVYSGADQRKHQSSASLAFVRGIHRGPVNSPHKRPVTRKMSPFDDVIMKIMRETRQIGRWLPAILFGFPSILAKFLKFIRKIGHT